MPKGWVITPNPLIQNIDRLSCCNSICNPGRQNDKASGGGHFDPSYSQTCCYRAVDRAPYIDLAEGCLRLSHGSPLELLARGGPERGMRGGMGASDGYFDRRNCLEANPPHSKHIGSLSILIAIWMYVGDVHIISHYILNCNNKYDS